MTERRGLDSRLICVHDSLPQHLILGRHGPTVDREPHQTQTAGLEQPAGGLAVKHGELFRGKTSAVAQAFAAPLVQRHEHFQSSVQFLGRLNDVQLGSIRLKVIPLQAANLLAVRFGQGGQVRFPAGRQPDPPTA